MVFDQALDLPRLQTALQQVLNHAPILRCTGDPAGDSNWTALATDVALARAWVVAPSLVTESERTAWHNCAVQPLQGPLLRLVVQADGQRALLTLHHAAGDGRSLLAVLQCLHAAYTGLSLPQLVTQRGAWTVLRGACAQPIAFALTVGRALLRVLGHPPRRSGPWSAGAATSHARSFIRVSLPGTLATVQAAARPRGYTVNDVLVATLALAWRSQRRSLGLPDAPFTTGILVDCRRYLTTPQAAIANWSSAEIFSSRGPAHRGSHEAFAISVLRACRQARTNMPGWLGLLSMSAAYATLPARWIVPRAEAHWYAATRAFKLGNWITNLGAIPPELLDFGDSRIVEAWPVVAAYEPPTTIAAIASVGDDLYLTLGSVEGHWDSSSAEQLPDHLRIALSAVLQSLAQT